MIFNRFLKHTKIENERKYSALQIDKDTRSAEDKVKQITEKLNKEIGELQNTIGRYNAPNLKADQRYGICCILQACSRNKLP